MTGQTDTIEETMNRVRQQAAESLECAAESVRNAGDRAAAISDLANGAGDRTHLPRAGYLHLGYYPIAAAIIVLVIVLYLQRTFAEDFARKWGDE